MEELMLVRFDFRINELLTSYHKSMWFLVCRSKISHFSLFTIHFILYLC